MTQTPCAAVTGLILSGGGARAAYQVGVLKAIAHLLEGGQPCNPFPVIVGTSAGAINAVGLACGALRFAEATRNLASVWQNFHTEQIYRSDWPGVLSQVGRFTLRHLLGLAGKNPLALLDNRPLSVLLREKLDFSGISAAVRQRKLQAVAITAFGYESGQAVTFYQGRATLAPWLRHRRIGVPTRLDVPHLLASAAIPMIFPPVKVDGQYYGDGALRQSAPISPALHLGATRILVIGVSGNLSAETGETPPVTGEFPPTLAQIGGHMLGSSFIDSLETDLEVVERLNLLARLLPEETRVQQGLREVEVLTISPSQPLDAIAARYRHELPRALRPFFFGPGAMHSSGAAVLSYLLFEPGYCHELMELGWQDALRQRDKLLPFLQQCKHFDNERKTL